MNGHLTSQQVTAWTSGVSDAEELLRLDDHLAECGECRELVSANSSAAIAMLRAEFSSAHLTEPQLDDYAQQRPLPAEVMQHLDWCDACRSEAEDLGKDAHDLRKLAAVPARRATPVWLRPMAAAVAITALGISAWFAAHRRPATPVPAPEEIASTDSFDSVNLQIPASITALSAAPIQLRSLDTSEPASAFHVLSPVATAVVDDAPAFRWTAIEGATFSVSVYDDRFHLVAKGASLKGTEWHPDKPLPRDAFYRWEVRAVIGSRVTRSPAATEPEARFQVLGEADALRLRDAGKTLHDKPIALGIAYANAGALDDARREFTAAVSDPKQKAAAERFLAQLK